MIMVNTYTLKRSENANELVPFQRQRLTGSTVTLRCEADIRGGL